MATTVITLKLTATEMLAIETLLEQRLYESRSGLLRTGLGLIFDKHHIDQSFDREIERERTMHKPRVNFKKRNLLPGRSSRFGDETWIDDTDTENGPNGKTTYKPIITKKRK